MRLQRVRIVSYRSISDFSPEAEPFVLDLASGLNLLIGPNNVGKSNIVRAIELALEPRSTIDAMEDVPPQAARARPRIELTFQLNDSESASDLVAAVSRLRALAGQKPPPKGHAGQLTFRVGFERDEDRSVYRRRADFGFAVGSDPEAKRALERAVKLFHQRVRFVITRSGQDLESILEGTFREILRDVVAETLEEQYAAALERRDRYIDDLQVALFGPLTAQVVHELTSIFPEVNDVELRPNIPAIDDSITSLTISVADAARTDLAAKGTGVRGGVIAAMFRYLAEHSKQSMVFAVEEPEAFLHPAAQESVRRSLEQLAHRDDVTVIATTHSPFMAPRTPDAQLIEIEKSPSGTTSIRAVARGDEPAASLVGGLFRDPQISYVLDRAAQIPPDAAGVLVVEGETDIRFLETAADRLGRSADLEGVHLVAAGGASAAATLTLVLQAATDRVVCSLFDNDGIGRAAHERLSGSTFRKLIGRKSVLSYKLAFSGSPHEYEAEDLFSADLQHRFARDQPDGLVTSGEHPDGTVHLDFPPELKEVFASFVAEHATHADCIRWGSILDALHRALGRPPGTSRLMPEAPTTSGRLPEQTVEGPGTTPTVDSLPQDLPHGDRSTDNSDRRRPTPLESQLNGADSDVRSTKRLLDDWAQTAGVNVHTKSSSYVYQAGGRPIAILFPGYRALDLRVDHLDADDPIRADLSVRLGKDFAAPATHRQAMCSDVVAHWVWIRDELLDPRRRWLASAHRTND